MFKIKMEVVVNTAKRKRRKNDDDNEAKKPFVARSALDVQKLQLEKLMKDPVSIFFEYFASARRGAHNYARLHIVGRCIGRGGAFPRISVIRMTFRTIFSNFYLEHYHFSFFVERAFNFALNLQNNNRTSTSFCMLAG